MPLSSVFSGRAAFAGPRGKTFASEKTHNGRASGAASSGGNRVRFIREPGISFASKPRITFSRVKPPNSAIADSTNPVASGAGGTPGNAYTDPDDAEVLIELRNVTKSFGKKAVLNGASFKIRRGEAVGIIGSSGTGKSTILRIMAGLLAPDSGEVFIRGEKRDGLLSDEKNPRLKVGMVFQSAALFDSLTVGENVGFKLYEHSDLPEVVIKGLIKQSLDSVGLSGQEDRYPAQLSGGMKKRAALARAIIKESVPGIASKWDGEFLDMDEQLEEVVMYDEPTAGLDPVASTVVEDLMRNMHDTGVKKDGAGAASTGGGVPSYIVVTHQHSTIRRAVDRIIFLHAGKVVWEGTSKEFDTTDEPIVRQFATGSLKGPIVY